MDENHRNQDNRTTKQLVVVEEWFVKETTDYADLMDYVKRTHSSMIRENMFFWVVGRSFTVYGNGDRHGA